MESQAIAYLSAGMAVGAVATTMMFLIVAKLIGGFRFLLGYGPQRADDSPDAMQVRAPCQTPLQRLS